MQLKIDKLTIYSDENLTTRAHLSDRRALLGPLNFSFSDQEPVTVLGHTGAGKSLLAQALMGTLAVNLTVTGTLTINGRIFDLADRKKLQALWGKTLVLLPQEPWNALNPLKKAASQIIEVGRFVLNQDKQTASKQSIQRLATLSLMDCQNKYPHQLSGGMAQRLTYAIISCANTPVMILDEPSKGLDKTAVEQLFKQIKHTSQQAALLTITHDLALCQRLGGKLLIIQQGRQLAFAQTKQLFTCPRLPYLEQLIAATKPPSIHKKFGSVNEVLLEMKDIQYSISGKTILNNVNLTLKCAQITLIQGISGVGKSTLGDLICGLKRPSRGHRSVDNQVGKLEIQKIYQEPTAVFAPGIPLKLLFKDVCKLHQIKFSSVLNGMEKLKLDVSLLQRDKSSLSGGELQRFALLRVFLLKPKIIVADEVTSRLDECHSRTILELLINYCYEQNAALVIISHQTEQIVTLADQIISLKPVLNKR
ncbi:ATP-binding cassette domain-containing protein [Gayadomonas joobiniege]|uniref:ATP-binding cassette domain-containing protein n=1 Tax=Gayadomonas joobiniege TaxID=1234606 RepID=UPI00037B0288|nr:ATP-binding cassette domain-containing protein [Gayadomonas joobiniege]